MAITPRGVQGPADRFVTHLAEIIRGGCAPFTILSPELPLAECRDQITLATTEAAQRLAQLRSELKRDRRLLRLHPSGTFVPRWVLPAETRVDEVIRFTKVVEDQFCGLLRFLRWVHQGDPRVPLSVAGIRAMLPLERVLTPILQNYYHVSKWVPGRKARDVLLAMTKVVHITPVVAILFAGALAVCPRS